MASPRDTLAKNRKEALDLVQKIGVTKTHKLLENADRELRDRLREVRSGTGSFTEVQLKATLAQVRATLRGLTPKMRDTVVDSAGRVAERAGKGVIAYLTQADEMFRGVGTQPLALEEAAVLDVAREGAQASVLRRLASTGEPTGAEQPHPAKQGILDRYGMNTIENFEGTLQQGLLTRAPWDDIRARLVDQSPFLRGAPASWAERIVRTEVMGAYARAGWEATREADEQLGDIVKILSATFDDRTACLVGSTRLTGAVVRAAFRRWYEGPLLRLVTESDRDLSATPHHPVLTRRGWVSAKLLQPGDDLVCDDGQEHTRSPRDEYITNGPAPLSEVFESLRASSITERRRGRVQDFHGDGCYGDVDVLRPHRELRYGRLPAFRKPFAENVFAGPNSANFCLECGALLGPGESMYSSRLRSAAHAFTRFLQTSRNEGLRAADCFADLLDRFTTAIATRDLFDRHVFAISGMETFGLESLALGMSVGTRESSRSEHLAHVSQVSVQRCGHVAHHHSRQVQFDRLIHIERTLFRGHVFNLTTTDGYFTANGIYSSNSDSYAVHGQIRLPEEAFETWYGLTQHPPARPNDREIVVAHRIAWKIPPYLKQMSDAQIATRWQMERRKGPVPARPAMTTVELGRFGR